MPEPVETGATKINWDLVLTEPGKTSLICYWNTRSYWSTAYHPGLNSLYVPYVDHCLEMTRAVPGRRYGMTKFMTNGQLASLAIVPSLCYVMVWVIGRF